MGRNKAGRYKKKEDNAPKKSIYRFDENDDDMMNDEIDAFHKQRDVIPLDVNEDVDESDEDDEHPVFDLADDENSDDDEDEDINDDDEDTEDESQLKGLAAKIARQQKYLQAKMGGANDEMDDASDEEEEKRAVWGRNKDAFYQHNEVHSSGEESLAEEEEEALRLQKEKAKSLSMEDFGLEDISEDESNEEPTFEESSLHGKQALKTSAGQDTKDKNAVVYKKVKKDLNALTREEQMDVVYSTAPEIVGLLADLNDAVDLLQNKVNPLVSKIVEGKDGMRGGLHYMEVKRLLLLSYCQAITFYLLFKSEGRSARDHPIIAQLTEIRTLVDKMKELDKNLPADLEDVMNKIINADKQVTLFKENAASESDSFALDPKSTMVSTGGPNTTKTCQEIAMPDVNSSKKPKETVTKFKQQDAKVGLQSMEMLKVRAALEERLKQKGVFSSLAQRNGDLKRHRQLINGQLETLDDFDDDALGGDASVRSSKVSHLVTQQMKRPKRISGDDDLPKRDDIGERRRKHELRVLASAGINSVDEVQDEADSLPSDGDAADLNMDGDSDSDLEVYKQVEHQRAAKVAAKAGIYSRPSAVPSLPETIEDGKRQITYNMEKNRGLTRSRNKKLKNPRKKYRDRYGKASERRKGQVREHRKPSGPYGGEASGINVGVSRSIRFKN